VSREGPRGKLGPRHALAGAGAASEEDALAAADHVGHRLLLGTQQVRGGAATVFGVVVALGGGGGWAQPRLETRVRSCRRPRRQHPAILAVLLLQQAAEAIAELAMSVRAHLACEGRPRTQNKRISCEH